MRVPMRGVQLMLGEGVRVPQLQGVRVPITGVPVMFGYGVRVPCQVMVPVGWAGARISWSGDGAEAVAPDANAKTSATTSTIPLIKASVCLAAAVDLFMCEPPLGSERWVCCAPGRYSRIILALVGYRQGAVLVYES